MNRRLHLIYIGYFVVLILAFMQSFMPMFSRAVQAGIDLANEHNHPLYLVAVQPELFSLPWAEIPASCEGVRLNGTLYEGFVSLSVDAVQQPVLDAVLSFYDSVISLLDWTSILSWLTILVLTALIIRSLRKSVRNQVPLPARNITLMRVIGALIIFDQLCQASNYAIGHKMVKLVIANGAESFSGGFPIEYGQVILGLLILFAAEIFALGSRLSEDQKLTI